MAKSIFVQREVEKIYESYIQYDWLYDPNSSGERYIRKPKENKGFIEKMKDFAWAFLGTIVLCIIFGAIAYLFVGCAKKPSVETNYKKKESVEVQNLVINNDFNEPAHVVIIDKDGNVDFEYYGIVNMTEKDGQQNIIVDVRENEGE